MYRPFTSAIGVFQVLESCAVRGIMVPYRQLEKDRTKHQVNLMVPVVPYMAL